ncbi:ArsR/SmtB family transcription factor [Pedobacter cryoconitis]|uniref:DNA-binding transcriptional ArsR family regulator/predicted transcriptional regulator n=1 Tax=Pedobacter cryoconitis TaxID=188932 RepID=A0A7X0J1F7_9SPHI|nr:helix-turn-helix transcriptional regulator [Pedobacter cryoconitis]MBB6499349.1 DNA-binding transcriptional ArsR family regulator/predicted transcriptional regulator [Pedobacter cryoconitis]
MEIAQLENIATLIGEPARIKMLWVLMDGKAYTATELSLFGEVSPQSASMHLGKLVQAGLLKVIAQGRHRYFSYANDEVAYAIEALANLVPVQKESCQSGAKNVPVKNCRTCYDHIAGKAGVAITDRILKLAYLSEKGQQYELTDKGHSFFTGFGIDTDVLLKLKRPFARPCLDWSERRFHLAGSLGRAILEKMFQDDWMRRTQNSRALVITSKGERSLYDILGVELPG